MNKIAQIRNILNALFMVGAVIALIIYFAKGNSTPAFVWVCGASLVVKMAEIMLRSLFRNK